MNIVILLWEENKTNRKDEHQEGNGYTSKQGQEVGSNTGQYTKPLESAEIRWNLHTSQNALAFPLTMARDKQWWSHYRSVVSPDI